MITSLFILSLIGFGISTYAFFVEQKLMKDSQYKAVCDVSDMVSCTKPLLSPYATLLGVSNTILGMLFYAAMAVCALAELTILIWYGSVVAVLMSSVFAYLLYFKIKSLCLICTSIYVVNLLLLYVAYAL
jgi:vitamin-K-epoxide reductase (warfarin-sensitive)